MSSTGSRPWASPYDRFNRDQPDADHPYDSVRTHYQSRQIKLDWQHNLQLCRASTLTLGAEYGKETARSSDYRTFLDWWTAAPA